MLKTLHEGYYIVLYRMYTYNNPCLIAMNMQRSILIEIAKDVC